MDNNNNTTRSGIGFFGLLGVAFIILKLCGVITWPWIWVLAPIWGSIALGLVILLIAVIFIHWFTK